MKFWEFIGSLDRRIIFLIIGLAVFIPLLAPLKLPVITTPTTEDVYNAIDSLENGSKILVSFEYGPSTQPEIEPMAIALMRQLFRKECQVVGMALWPDGQFMSTTVFDRTAEQEFGLEWGTDYVNLGFRPGGEAVIKGIAREFRANYTQDVRGNSVNDLAIMEGVYSVKDFDFIFSLSAGYPGTVEWVLYAADPYKIPMSSGTTAIQVNEVIPYVKGGQIYGILAGMSGAAEYETLVKAPDDATKFMDAQSIAHLLIVVFIVVGNISYIVQRRKQN
ncbi:MAG: hypothetical protein HKN20_15175 [Gemmatimonadetes bacterium]|nr:hypothetical protein [Gemmatimonadota bacterium]